MATHASVLAWRIPMDRGAWWAIVHRSKRDMTEQLSIEHNPFAKQEIKREVTRYLCHSVTKSCPTLCNPMDCSMPDFPVLHYLLAFAQTHVIESVMPSNCLILCRPLLLPPSVFPSISIFSESALHVRWPKYWSFSFSISPSGEYSGFISFRMDLFDLSPV